jgi:NADP-dependent 3-hydroxy acid dehydrogenase YdfG
MSERVVWVTGASTGIGFEIAKAFSKAGDIVIATGRRKSRLVSLVNEIRFAGREAYAFVCNIQSERSIISTKKKILERCGSIDIIVNNAGITVFKPFIETKSHEFDNLMDTNLRGGFLMAKLVLPIFIRKRKGQIINILSVAANSRFTDSAVYSASKAAMMAMFNVLREEVRRFNIKITNIYPGPVDTAMWESKARLKYRNRMMTPKEIADIVVHTSCQPQKVVVEDVIIRPMKGDI